MLAPNNNSFGTGCDSQKQPTPPLQPGHILSNESGPKAESKAQGTQITEGLQPEGKRKTYAQRQAEFRAKHFPNLKPPKPDQVKSMWNNPTYHCWSLELSPPSPSPSPPPGPTSAASISSPSTAACQPSSSVQETSPSKDASSSLVKNIPGTPLKK
ncbi:hypothetical protein SMACR_05103 [Sordaria macrospora]|uniref:WGS project CABT00000000 data, contig 2.22 n=2 Tax=Sordaria macrospora TaxID=5147 RepID=F7W2P0_SORMK|nr:uncharacterized protein SMAC_05103 [Sordaria macrospora k-hell]KAA8623908.1 hypothetical protein SMACR_05103 [Sordaria macrospora]KAH7632519.1 hypothetical protein B0T09DRAFT_380052 [Sordaria sp. MPI-SDFR-AT-0083]WPJ60995.1 hypothetical protein SMAC4_05103 [Sordaria macrospora]CCC11891.1 unnamed protein product [Sordaria macrospora k-hell]